VAILDNCSDQDYSLVLAEYGDLSIEYVRNDSNIGASGNVAKALRMAVRADYLIVFNDDDLMHPRMLEWQVAALDSRLDAVMAVARFQSFDSAVPPPLGLWATCSGRHLMLEGESGLARTFLRGTPISFGSTMYRSGALTGLGLDFERFDMIADRPYLLDVARKGQVVFFDEPLVLYRLHAAQDSRSDVLSTAHIVELMVRYREAFPAEIEAADQRLFLRHATNNLVDSYTRLRHGRLSAFPAFVKQCRTRGTLRWRSLDVFGALALLRMIGLEDVEDLARRARRLLRGGGRS
jgi:hypothetical protein